MALTSPGTANVRRHTIAIHTATAKLTRRTRIETLFLNRNVRSNQPLRHADSGGETRPTGTRGTPPTILCPIVLLVAAELLLAHARCARQASQDPKMEY